jgi:hypothetical protein
MQVCTGAVIDFPPPPILRQIDLIIWAPFPATAIFDVDGFGLVPKSSAFGVIEVKRSNYKGADKRLDDFLKDVEVRKIVSDPSSPFPDDHNRFPGLGIIPVLEKPLSRAFQKLIESKKAVVIFDTTGERPIVRHKDVIVLVNFLQFITWRYRVHTLRTSPLEVVTYPFDLSE